MTRNCFLLLLPQKHQPPCDMTPSEVGLKWVISTLPGTHGTSSATPGHISGQSIGQWSALEGVLEFLA